MKIINKNKQIKPYDEDKVIHSVLKAMTGTNNINVELIEKILGTIENMYENKDEIEVEEIEQLIINKLIKNNRQDVVKTYKFYNSKKVKERMKKRKIKRSVKTDYKNLNDCDT